MVQQCGFLLQQALDADEANLKEQALEMYIKAVQLGIEIVSFYYFYTVL